MSIHALCVSCLFSNHYLGSNNLTGMIPSEFGMIESLRSLDLGEIT